MTQRVRLIDKSKTRRTPSKSSSGGVNILQAMSDPQLFAPWFRDRTTWLAWRSFLAALFALPMTKEQLSIYRECTGREEPPDHPAQEAWLVIGRRGGKSFTLALIAVFLACFKDYRRYLAPGEKATVMVIAADRKQARIILRYVRGLLTNIPMLSRLIERETKESFELSNSTCIEVHSASFRSTRGYSLAAVIADEIAFWPTDETSAEPDREILNALRPGLATIPGSMLLCASSPYARRGELWAAHRRHFGKDGDPVLVWQASTRQMNPTISERFLEREFERDPVAADAEYNARFRSDVSAFIDRASIEGCISQDVKERPPEPGTHYVGFVDPSGGGSDSFTLAIGHREYDSDQRAVVIDAIREIKPRFDPDAVVIEFANLLQSYGVYKVSGDRYAGIWPAERFDAHGIKYEPSEKPKSQIYIEALPLLNSKGIKLLDDARLISQLCDLERRTVRGSGRESIDHAPGAKDDVANAVCGVASMLTVFGKKYRHDVDWSSGDDSTEQFRAASHFANTPWWRAFPY